MPTNDMERLCERLKERFPEGSYSILKPRPETGSWFLDVTLMGYDLVIEWRPGRGFGLSTPSAGDQFLGPDEVYEDLDSAYERAKALLLSQTPTKPPVDATLPELRRTRRPSQVDMAQQLSIDHSACSRMEWRSDILVGTVRDVVAAMGGELKLLAEFPHRTLEIQIDQILNGDAPRAS